jgi:hypothetical protein
VAKIGLNSVIDPSDLGTRRRRRRAKKKGGEKRVSLPSFSWCVAIHRVGNPIMADD